MSSPYPYYKGVSVLICQRCGAVLPPNEYSCYRCGYLNAPPQAADSTANAQSPSTIPHRRAKKVSVRSGAIAGVSIGIVVLLVLLIWGGLYTRFLPSRTASHAATTPKAAHPTPKVTPLFADSFKSDTNGWNLEGDPGNYSVAVGKGVLTLEDDNNTLLWELLPGSRPYSNFQLMVDAALTKGTQENGYGIYIRGTANQQSDLATYYRFELYGDGSYAIFKGVLNASGQSTSTKIVNYTTSTAIQLGGKINHIIILARGPWLSFIVNNQTLKVFSDYSYTSGSIALFVSNLQGSQPGAQAQFSHFAIYPA